MPTKFLVGQMVQSVLHKGAQIFANSEHLNAKIYLMYERLVTMSSKLPTALQWDASPASRLRAPELASWGPRTPPRQ